MTYEISDDLDPQSPYVHKLGHSGRYFWREERVLNVSSNFTDFEKSLFPHWLSTRGMLKINSDMGAALYGNQDFNKYYQIELTIRAC